MRFSRNREALRTTPWRRRTPHGVYFGHNGTVWAYFEWPLSPLQWEDPPVRLRAGGTLNSALSELGATAVDLGGGMRTFALNRSVHLFAATFDRPQPVPESTAGAHVRFLQQVLPSISPGKTLLVGVKLWPAIMRNLARGGGSGGNLVAQTKALLTRNVDSEDSFDAFRADYDDIREILTRAGATTPDQHALAQLESWFNFGNGPDAQVHATATDLHVVGGGSWELSALTRFTRPTLSTPDSQWLLEAMAHADPAVAVSVRADLTPNTVIQAQLRQSQRKLRAAEEEEARTGDITRDEIAERATFAKDLENNVRAAQHAWLTETSILFARAHDTYSDSNSSFLDLLRNSYGIEAKTLEHRQLDALDEMQPCSATRANPFTQVLNPAAVAFAGLPAFSTIGDPGNLWLGRVDPDYPSCFVDTFGAPRQNKPAPMAILGDSGSGKTFAAQLLAGQAALSGVQTIMINPKGFDSLASFADWVREYGVPATVVSMTEMEGEGGAFDPFRFAEPQMAAEILNRHILTVLGTNYGGGLTGHQEIMLGEGLQRGAEDGARCAYDALQYVSDPSIVELVLAQAKYSSMFRLGFGYTPKPAFHTGEKGLTLIQFDREMPLPPEGKPPSAYERDERVALAALRLVTRASMEILMRAGGGVMVVDEAHHYLNSPEGLASIQRLGREGRSLNLLPIFATQRVSDLLDADMENHLSRVLCMKLTDPVEASAALRLCGLEVTEERIAFLREAGPRGSSNGRPGRPSLGLFRDLYDRHSVVMIGPVPEDIRLAFSTNPDDRRKRAALRGRATDEPKDPA